MPRNVEIKARVADLVSLQTKVAAIATSGPTEIAQDDTFFRCTSGRLKLRAFSAREGELIFYQRPDTAGTQESFYLRSPTGSPDTLREALTHAHGQAGRVVKLRTLYSIGRTRVHLDRVEHLGEFMELEVVLAENEPAAAGHAEAQALLVQLGIASASLVKTAYVDLLAAR